MCLRSLMLFTSVLLRNLSLESMETDVALSTVRYSRASSVHGGPPKCVFFIPRSQQEENVASGSATPSWWSKLKIVGDVLLHDQYPDRTSGQP